MAVARTIVCGSAWALRDMAEQNTMTSRHGRAKLDRSGVGGGHDVPPPTRANSRQMRQCARYTKKPESTSLRIDTALDHGAATWFAALGRTYDGLPAPS
jgi:hypothetical protein